MRIAKGLVICLVMGTVQLPQLGASALAQSIPGGASASDVIPADFRGKITYEGAFEGTRTTPARASRRTDLGSLVGAATSEKSDPFRGGTVYEIEYNGELIKGTIRETGAWNATGTFAGTRNGSTCQLVYDNGTRITAECNMNRYFARVTASDARGRVYRSVVEANRTNFVDYVERDKQLAINAEKARVAAAEAAARYAALPNAGPALTRRFDSLVQIDSQGWAFNRYAAGSLRNVKIVSGKAGVGTYVMHGEYTYNGGQSGWVMAEMNGQNLSCIQFWDAVMGCRGLRTPQQGQAMRSAAANAFMGGGSGAGSSSTGSRDADDFYQHQQHQATIQEYNRR